MTEDHDQGKQAAEPPALSVLTQPRAMAAISAVLLALLVFFTAIPGVFTIDENSYLVSVLGIREGRLTLPGTEGLPPSNELLYFEPGLHVMEVRSTPVTWSVPPLYAFLAQPFALLGFRGLILLNSLSFAALAFLVWSHVNALGRRRSSAWIGALMLAFGSYLLEYAQGAWPHALSACLVFGAFHIASLVRRERSPWLAILAGILAGIAAGVRYQSAFLAGVVGLGLLLTPKRRLAALGSFAVGFASILAITSVLNHARVSSWHPASRTAGYLNVKPQGSSNTARLADAAMTFWGRTVDYRALPVLDEARARFNPYLQKDPNSGAITIGGAMKKSWLQSMPWAGLPLILLAWFAIPTGIKRALARSPKDAPESHGWLAPEVRRELAAVALVVFPVLALFAWAGSARIEGFGFNQRYLIDLIPFAAAAFALLLDRFELRWRGALAGSVLGLVLAWASTLAPSFKLHLLSMVPLALAVVLLASWFVAARPQRAWILWVAAGCCAGWSLGVHLSDDLPAARETRAVNRRNAEFVASRLPDKSAVFAWWGAKDALGPLQLERDLVILDAWADQGNAAPLLTDALLDSGRHVFVLTAGFPPRLIRKMTEGKRISARDSAQRDTIPPIVEIVRAPRQEGK